MVKAQQEVQFADVTPERLSSVGSVAVTVRIAGAEALYWEGNGFVLLYIGQLLIFKDVTDYCY